MPRRPCCRQVGAKESEIVALAAQRVSRAARLVFAERFLRGIVVSDLADGFQVRVNHQVSGLGDILLG
jgi:hypothetical protein